MKISEKILLRLSRRPQEKDLPAGQQKWDIDSALDILKSEFPNFLRDIHGKRILDFGCGVGFQSVALIKSGAKFVLGVDIDRQDLEKAGNLRDLLGYQSQIKFVSQIGPEYKKFFDIIISQNSMEHFLNPEEVINLWKNALNDNGSILITFGPPWYAPYGAHMQFFTNVPWVNVLFPESTVMSVRKHFRDDGAKRYEDVEGGLSRMSVAKFERIVANCGMRIEFKKYNCVKGINALGHLPGVRELFINQITCVLKKK